MRNLYLHNDTWYQIIRVLKIHNVSNKDGSVNMEVLKAWRDYLDGDHVLRQNDDFLICETVQEPEWEEITEVVENETLED
jgi:calcineurin-like phosphoesterase family protein